ncbi:merozoite surface glycoprotein, putative [Babesia ovata]|uniref:Merozoite surface glycoprotein, putative n=1 Tax=Babesia ovata TaxID=189622 RepID=A0A2H6KEE9_9APIC|nr:merozoite surface glycoprotein, putative [Babesia ovata]GBE61378.1 merozoite surface glycoprotein, putative [Babesia ovata]
MKLINVYVAALCCFVAEAVKATTSPSEAEAPSAGLSSSAVQQINVKKRTLREEFILFAELMAEWEKSKRDIHMDDMGLAEQSKLRNLEAAMAETMNQLYGLGVSVGIDMGIDGIFALQNENDPKVPEYRGLNRYKFVSGIIYSMAKKIKALSDYVDGLEGEETPKDLKATLMKLGFGEADEISDSLLNLDRVKRLISEYLGDDAPLSNLLKLLPKLEEKMKAFDKAEKNPFRLHYTKFKAAAADEAIVAELAEADKIAADQAEKNAFSLVWEKAVDEKTLTDEEVNKAEADVRKVIDEAAKEAARKANPGYRAQEPLPHSPHAVIPGADGIRPTVVVPLPPSQISLPESSGTELPQQPQQLGGGDGRTGVEEGSAATTAGPEQGVPEATSLRQPDEASTEKKPSSAFDSFVTAILFVSITFAL